jgi:hypothetical protein
MIQLKQFLVSFGIVFLCATSTFAQSDNIQLGSRQYGFLDRLEVKLRTDSVLNFSAVKPYNRETITQRLEYIKQM